MCFQSFLEAKWSVHFYKRITSLGVIFECSCVIFIVDDHLRKELFIYQLIKRAYPLGAHTWTHIKSGDLFVWDLNVAKIFHQYMGKYSIYLYTSLITTTQDLCILVWLLLHSKWISFTLRFLSGALIVKLLKLIESWENTL